MAHANHLESYPRGVGQKGEKKENVMKRQILAMIALGAVIGAPLMAMEQEKEEGKQERKRGAKKEVAKPAAAKATPAKAPIDLSEPPAARRQRLAREAGVIPVAIQQSRAVATRPAPARRPMESNRPSSGLRQMNQPNSNNAPVSPAPIVAPAAQGGAQALEECPICMDAKTGNRAPCCDKEICPQCWTESLEATEGACPFCRTEASGV